MKLTDALWRWKKALPKGNIWRGKYRLVKPVTSYAVLEKIREYEVEEENMFYLRNPYLTLEQSKGQGYLFNHHEKFLQKQKEKKLAWKDHKLLGDRFGFLKVAEKWE